MNVCVIILTKKENKVKVTKVGRFLHFRKDAGNSLSYDFSDKSFIKITNYRNPRTVISPQSFFRGMTFNEVFDGCVDDKYKKFILKVQKANNRCSNIGTFLQRLHRYQNLEQWILQGFDVSWSCKVSIQNIPKNLLRIMKGMSSDQTEPLISNPQLGEKVIQKSIEYLYKEEGAEAVIAFLNRSGLYNFIALVETYNYEYRSLIKYVKYLKEREGFNPWSTFSQIYDYARMQRSMTLKYNKYPKYFATVHDIVTQNYNIFKKEYSKKLFENNLDLSLEHIGINYCMVVPREPDHIKQEGVNLHHCVASYISDVSEGRTKIIFLRKKNKPEKSLITVEIRKKKVTQASGEYNRRLSSDEMEYLRHYCKKRDIKI